MLFNSLEFIFVFLPVTLLVYAAFNKFRLVRGAKTWLVGCSLFFYGWWNIKFLWLIVVSVLVNFIVGYGLIRNPRGRSPGALVTLAVGIVFNLCLLGYFKYADFLLTNLSAWSGSEYHPLKLILPIGISFFTFQQIAFLVDSYRGEASEPNFLNYALFVTFFPQLIAGPIVHHKEMMPQFEAHRDDAPSLERLPLGLTFFSLGLFKKVVLAQQMALYADPVFSLAGEGKAVGAIDAWIAGLAYTLQLYFDFSGYSDMAIGLGCMFAIKLPLNFHSPYKAVGIIDFWRRWHITLSNFFRDYVYFPLGGGRRGVLRKGVNILFTMLLIGLWHGAGWTFILWGALHGIYLTVNHAWRGFRIRKSGIYHKQRRWAHWPSRLLTFLAVVVGWVIFRAENWDTALIMLNGMADFSVLTDPRVWVKTFGGGSPDFAKLVWIGALLFVVWFLPNTQQLMAEFNPALNMPDDPARGFWSRIQWKPGWAWAAFSALAAGSAVIITIATQKTPEFLYFQF